MGNIYQDIADKIKDDNPSEDIDEWLVKKIIETYEELSPSIAGNVPPIVPPCTECGSHNVKMGEISLDTPRYWVQDLHCQDCGKTFGRFNPLQNKEKKAL